MRHLSNSKHIQREHCQHRGSLEDSHPLEVTVVLKENLSHQQLKEVEDFCHSHNLTFTHSSSHHGKVRGFAKDFSHAFGVTFTKYELHGKSYHAHNEDIQVPFAHIDHILGFDTAPIARPYFRKHSGDKGLSKFTPLQLARLYNFPPGDGTGQVIGIIELGGGYQMSDLTKYFSELGISGSPNVVSIGQNNPADQDSSGEVVLDIEIIAALVPKAQLRVYFGQNTDQGFYNAINQAIQDHCTCISISWGGPERYWSSTSLNSFNALFQKAANNGITVCVASGDSGSSDGVPGKNVDFPCSSPYTLACGGTHLNSNGTTITSEVVWNDSEGASGGGISRVFSLPSYQRGIKILNTGYRGVPDVAGCGDPETGWVIYFQGQNQVFGGTSAVAPLWSGLIARINQSLNQTTTSPTQAPVTVTTKTVGFINPILYQHPTVCRDIVSGSNGAYSATVGWDCCSGLGSPNGQAILNIFKTQAQSHNP